MGAINENDGIDRAETTLTVVRDYLGLGTIGVAA